MARNLYRFYLYAVFLVMLVFAAVGLGQLLQPLLALTALRGSYSQSPTNMAIVQGIVFFGISWVVAGLLGGLHYWLIRRDMQTDSDAGNQGVRAFFLNIAELIAAPLGIGLAAGAVIAQLGQPYSGDVSGSAATAIASLALFTVFELERRRAPASNSVALFFQRFHLYGVQFILLNILVFTWVNAFSILVNIVAYAGQAFGTGSIPCTGFVACSSGPNLLSALAAALWMAVFWLGYGWLARNDPPSLFRRIVLAISFAYGIGLLLYGIFLALALVFRFGFGNAPSAVDALNNYDFAPYITLGLLVSAAYLIWLRPPARQQPARAIALPLYCQAIIGALMAGAFFWGIGYALLNLLELPVMPSDWAEALALMVTGAAYVVFDVRLRLSNRTNAEGALEARRGFVFALLGAAVIAAAIGGATALYTWITAQIGSPIDNWQHIAHIGLAAFIVGVGVLALYLWQASREQLISSLGRHPSQEAPATPELAATTTQQAPINVEPQQLAPVSGQTTIEAVLDDLLAGKISREAAAQRIRDLTIGVRP